MSNVYFEHLFVTLMLYVVVGVMMDRLLEPVLNWSARRIDGHFERVGELLKDSPWRQSVHGRIFFWPSTVALAIVGVGAAIGTRK